jgi:CubicO group peptidase (beta-lactamase class C family)
MFMLTSRPNRVDVQGDVATGFEGVRDAFAENFARRALGGACCGYHRGGKVVDLRGGVRNERTNEPWERDTMVLVYSASKGLGSYQGELLRRIDPRHRSLGQFFEDEIAAPLGEDVYIRLPAAVPNARLATLARPGAIDVLLGFPLRLALAGWNHRSNIYRALVTNPGFAVAHDEQRVYARNLEVPSGGAVGTARGIAHACGVFAAGGREPGLRQETLELLAAPATPPTHGFFDQCLKGELRFSLGFMKPSPAWPFGGARSFGSPGSGGSLGFADPAAGVGYACLTSRMRRRLTGDPRDVALRDALYTALASRDDLGSEHERIAS